MPSVLPTENTQDKAVDTWGIGTYDSQRDEDGEHGENSEKREPAGRSLPDDATKSPQTNSPEEWLSYPNEPDSRTVTNLVSSIMRLGPLPDGTLPPEECDEEEDDEEEDAVLNVFNPDRALSYPDSADARLGTLWHRGFIAMSEVPGDADANIQHFHPKTEIYDARVESSAQEEKKSILPQEQGVDGRDPGAMGPKQKKTSEEHSELPVDGTNPSARADYYDYMHPGHAGSTQQAFLSDYIAPTEDMGAYAGKKKDTPEESELPGVMKNEETMDNDLQSLGNWWQGKEIEDITSPQGFPTTDFDENIDYDRSDNQDGGTIVPLGDPKMFASGRTSMQTRRATNITQVVALTKDFIQEAGKKDLTKRHVLAFLQQKGLPQYLSSDIIRCLKISHDIHVKDVLDEFPVYRQASAASQTSIARARAAMIALECKHVLEPEVSSVLRRCAANMTRALLDMERLERGTNRKADIAEAEKCFDEHADESCKTAYDAYVNGCKQVGETPMSHEDWLRGYTAQALSGAGKN